jgi:hypothetical protein
VIDFVKNKNHSLNLNFMVGQLALNASGSAEFKSGNACVETMSTFTSMLPADMRSHVSDAGDRSIRGMQDQQSNCASRATANNSATGNNAKNRTTGGSAFANKKKWMKEGRSS